MIQSIFQVGNLLNTHTHIYYILAITDFTFVLVNFEWKSILAEGDICASQRRASSEGLGYLARFGNDIFTARMASFSVFFSSYFVFLTTEL